jgi:hypothetical protein
MKAVGTDAIRGARQRGGPLQTLGDPLHIRSVTAVVGKKDLELGSRKYPKLGTKLGESSDSSDMS